MLKNLELKDYTYKELCHVLNEKVKQGKSRQLQLNRWRKLFEWENPSSRIYRITKIYEVPKEMPNNRGGARAGAGAKLKVQEEFDVLIHNFLHDPKVQYDYQEVENGKVVIYFSNDAVCKYFGIYRDIYQAFWTNNDGEMLDKKLNLSVHNKITNKLTEKSRSWIFNKISKMENVELSYGILAYTGSGSCECRDDLLDLYLDIEERFLKENGLRNVYDVKNKKFWDKMKKYITNEINEYLCNDDQPYCTVKKVRKIQYSVDVYDNYLIDDDHVDVMRKRLNDKIREELYEYFLKKQTTKRSGNTLVVFNEEKLMEDYVHILKTYVKI